MGKIAMNFKKEIHDIDIPTQNNSWAKIKHRTAPLKTLSFNLLNPPGTMGPRIVSKKITQCMQGGTK